MALYGVKADVRAIKKRTNLSISVIENYEKSLELNSDNKGGKEALMKLKK